MREVFTCDPDGILIERAAEIAVDKPWPKIRRTLEALQVTEFQRAGYRYFRRNELTGDIRNTLKSLSIKPPATVLSVEKPTAA